jgi:hypothetical protein
MQKQRKTIQWIVEAVESGRINPLWPDMSVIPDDILEEIAWEEIPGGEIVPKQAAVDIAISLLVYAKKAEIARNDRQVPSLEANEVMTGIECITVLATLERLKRAGYLEYGPPSAEGWVYASGKIRISKLNVAVYREQHPQIFEQIWNLKNRPNN